jgi:hypothetical protein
VHRFENYRQNSVSSNVARAPSANATVSARCTRLTTLAQRPRLPVPRQPDTAPSIHPCASSFAFTNASTTAALLIYTRKLHYYLCCFWKSIQTALSAIGGAKGEAPGLEEYMNDRPYAAG